jgi:trigger factor
MDNERLQKKSELKAVSASKREIELEVPESEVRNEFERILGQYSSQAKIPGFRVGKAPREMVKQMFYPDIRQSVMDSLAPKALSESLKVHEIHPATVPMITDLHLKEGEPFRFKALVEVWPDFDVPPYKNLKAVKREVTVQDEEIEHSLEDIRLRSADYVPVEGRGVAVGDYVMAEVQGKDLKTKKFFPMEKVVILAGHADNEKVLNENLLELLPNQERIFTITYPADHRNKKVAGKEVEYRLKVLTIKEKKVPALDDEFAKDLGEYKDLADLRGKIKEEILKSRESAVKQEIGEELLQNVVGQVDVELPETLVAEEAETVLKRALASSSGREIDSARLQPLKEDAKKRAVENIKKRLVLRKIAEREGLAVTEQEIEGEIQRLARMNDVPLAKVREGFQEEDRREDLRSHLLLRKAVDFLVESAIIS